MKLKSSSLEKIEITHRFYIDELKLTLDKSCCFKCELCSVVCPKDAIVVTFDGENLDIDIDETRCVFCEVCSYICPKECIEITYNGTPKRILLEKKAFPPFPEKISLNEGRCPSRCQISPSCEGRWCRQKKKIIENVFSECPRFCFECVESCPQEALKIGEDNLSLDVSSKLCIRCMKCEDVCKYEALSINKIFLGKVEIDWARCPKDCQKCIDLCPSKAIERDGEKVFVKEDYCILCGLCKVVCDKDAVTIRRENVVLASSEFTQIWEDTLKRLKYEL